MNEMKLMEGLAQIIVFLLVFFAFFLLTLNSKKRTANKYLAVFLILTAFDLSALFLSNVFLRAPLIISIKNASTLVLMPLFLFYVQETINSRYKVKWIHLLHLLPFVVFFIAHIFRINILLGRYVMVSEIQFLIYIAWVIFVLRKYKRVYLENYTNFEDLDYRWLMQITVAFILAHIFVYVKLLSYYVGSESDFLIAQLIVTFSAFAITCWIVLKALYRPELFRGLAPDILPVRELKERDKEIPKGDKESDIRKLIDFMTNREPYLNPKLTIKELAELQGFPEKELSILINHYMDKHFFDFVNEFRIEKAKELLLDPKKKQFTILEILYEVGFNSKSSFNTAFKKYTGMTPSSYRKSKHSLRSSTF